MNAFLRVLGWSYMIAIVLVNLVMGIEVYQTTPPNLDPWQAVFNEYGVFTFVFWVEVVAILLPGIIMLAIRDMRIKLKEKAELDAKLEQEDDFSNISEQEIEEKLQENHTKNGGGCTKCNCH